MVNYFILANLYALLFYALYLWTLKGRNNHRWSRFYLLLSATMALLLPFLRIDFSSWGTATGSTVQQVFQLPEVVLQAAQQTSAITNETWLFILYASVVLAFAARLAYQSLSLYFFLKQQHFVRQGKHRIAFNTGQGPASFGSAIIFPGNEADKMILQHEMAHLDYKHHYDKMAIKALLCLFFPVVALNLIRRELEIVHEFEADHIANTDTETYALLLVNRHFNTNQIQLLQSFFHHPLKRRIMMLQQSRKGKRALLIAALACTTTGIILLQSQEQATAQKKVPLPVQRSETDDQKVFTMVEQIPDPGFDLMKYLAENIKYPESARNNEITGNVVAQFIVDASGKVRNIKIIKPLTPDCATEVVRVLKAMPNWKPGFHQGKAVNVYYTLPVSFRLK